MNGTFSSSTQGTGFRASRRNTSPTSDDRNPRIPRVRPAWLKSWHGKPAVNRSTPLGKVWRSLTSSRRRTPGNRAARTAAAAGSFSHRRTGRWPARDSPSSSPPIPANRPATRMRVPVAAGRRRCLIVPPMPLDHSTTSPAGTESHSNSSCPMESHPPLGHPVGPVRSVVGTVEWRRPGVDWSMATTACRACWRTVSPPSSVAVAWADLAAAPCTGP